MPTISAGVEPPTIGSGCRVIMHQSIYASVFCCLLPGGSDRLKVYKQNMLGAKRV